VQIDFGFVVAALVPMIVVLITSENHLQVAWRVCLGLGAIPPLSLLYLRYKLDEPESFKRETMAKTKTPWMLCVKFYWFRLMIVSVIWLVYNFSSYAFGLFSSQLLANLLGDSEALWVSFGWNTLLTFFYMPGAIAGAWLSDWIGPRAACEYNQAHELVGLSLTASSGIQRTRPRDCWFHNGWMLVSPSSGFSTSPKAAG
jgi:MFS family permease